MPTTDPPPADSLCLEIAARSETLWERLRRAPTDEARLPPPELVDHHLAPWIRVWSKDRPQALHRRLSWDGVDPRRAAAAVLAPPPLERPPAWTADLLRYAERAADQAGREPPPVAAEPIAFGELWQPWIELGAAQLAEAAGPRIALLTRAARADLETRLLAEIAFLSEAAAYEVFKEQRERRGAEAGAYPAFVDACLADPLAVLYRRFPVLARQSCRRLRQWRQGAVELLERLERDLPDVAATFFEGRPPGRVAGVSSGISDRHHDGRQVFVLGFESGRQLVYKPRSLEPEAALAGFLGWCAESDLELAPPAARVLLRPGYGWMEHVAQEGLPSPAAAGEYYRRAGCLLALAYALRIEDLNAENLVATAGGPVVVDAEVAIQPNRARLSSGESTAEARDALGSCLDTALLTQLRPDGGEDREMGGLRGWSRRSKFRRVWHGINGDRMDGEVGTEWQGPLANTVFVDDELVDPARFVDEVRDGFTTAYRFLQSKRRELLAEGGPLAGFAAARVRVLFRDSQEYGRILQLMGLPRNQRSGLAGSWLQEAMLAVFADSRENPLLWPLGREERRALAREDVPWFGLSGDAEAPQTAEGTELPGVFACSGLTAVRRRLAALSPEDLETQLGLVGEALSEPAAGPLAAALAGDETADLATRQRRLVAAIGEAVAAAPVAEGAAGDRWDLANGRLGTALFLAVLEAERADATGGHAAAIERLLGGLDSPGTLATLRAGDTHLGAFSGLGSIVWSLVWLSRLLRRPALLGPAAEIAGWITPERLREARLHDLATGVAGALMGLLALAEAGDAGALAGARLCGERLLARQEAAGEAVGGWRNPGGLVQAGWAHGTAGILRALAALAVATGESRYLEAARAALDHERDRFDAEQGNWPVLLTDGRGVVRRQWAVGGCWGAPGIALSRLYLPPQLHDHHLESERRRALATTAGAPLQSTDHLCCGLFGRSSILLSAARRTAVDEWETAARELARAGIERAAEKGGFSVGSDPYENRRPQPGLLNGVAGIGYQILRLSGERRLPDVLALELPSERRERGEETR